MFFKLKFIRTIDPKPCNPRTLQKPKKGGGYPKVFLGGLPSNVTETDLRVFFGRYGKVMEVVIMYDQEKKKSRGFGFLSFEDDASVERVTAEHYINLNGKQVEIKKAEPRDGSGANNPGNLNNMNNTMNAGKMNSDNSQWPPQGAPLGNTEAKYNRMKFNKSHIDSYIFLFSGMMQATGPNGQIGGPPINMPIGAPNMMQQYQGWGTSPPQQQGKLNTKIIKVNNNRRKKFPRNSILNVYLSRSLIKIFRLFLNSLQAMATVPRQLVLVALLAGAHRQVHQRHRLIIHNGIMHMQRHNKHKDSEIMVNFKSFN